MLHTGHQHGQARVGAGDIRLSSRPSHMMGAGGDSGIRPGQEGFALQDHTAEGKLGNPIGQPLVQMGKLRPREGKGFTQSLTESYTARPVVLLS